VPWKLLLRYYLPALLDPSLKILACISQLALDHTNSSLRMCLSSLDELRDPVLHPEMGIRQHGVFLFVGPDEVSDVLGGDGQHELCSGDADSDGDGGSKEDVAVARDDGTGHGGDEDVESAWENLLAGFPRWG